MFFTEPSCLPSSELLVNFHVCLFSCLFPDFSNCARAVLCSSLLDYITYITCVCICIYIYIYTHIHIYTYCLTLRVPGRSHQDGTTSIFMVCLSFKQTRTDIAGANIITFPYSEGGMIRLETLIELKFINSSFSNSIFCLFVCCQFELFELILLLTLHKQLPVEQFEASRERFEAAASQSTVPCPPLKSFAFWPVGPGKWQGWNIYIYIYIHMYIPIICLFLALSLYVYMYIYIYIYAHTYIDL